jgi:hypothetical protein
MIFKYSKKDETGRQWHCEQSNELIIFFVYLRKMPSTTIGKVFFLSSSFAITSLLLPRYILKREMISSLHRMAVAREKNMITITFRDEICSNFLFNAIIYVPRIFFISQTYWFFRHERVFARLHFSLSPMSVPVAPH